MMRALNSVGDVDIVLLEIDSAVVRLGAVYERRVPVWFLRTERDADLDDDVAESAGAEGTPKPIRAVGQLGPCPSRQAGVERRPRIAVHRAIGQNGHEPSAKRDEQ